jgi:hypothetical protein
VHPFISGRRRQKVPSNLGFITRTNVSTADDLGVSTAATKPIIAGFTDQ